MTSPVDFSPSGAALSNLGPERLLKGLLCMLLLVAFGMYTRGCLALARAWDGWTVGDWLINLAGGWVRRGVSGEVVILLARWTGWPLNMVVLGIQLTACAAFFVMLIRLMAPKRPTFGFACLCLSPAFVDFYITGSSGAGRKEVLFFLLYAAWVSRCAGVARDSWRGVMPFVIAGGLLTLCHEAFFFYSFYFPFAAYLVSGRFSPKVAMVPAVSLLAMVWACGWGGSPTDAAICARVVELGAAPRVCEGVMQWHAQTVADALGDFLRSSSWKTAVGAIVLPGLVFVPAMLFRPTHCVPPPSHLRWGIVGLFMATVPLFLVATDWGRWVNIHATLLVTTFTLLLPPSGSGQDARSDAPGGARQLAGLAALFLPVLLIDIRHCCNHSAFGLGGWLLGLKHVF